jgi:hypothetical protein
VQDLLSYALSLVNIAHIATICGDTSGASHILNQAKNIFGSSIDLRDRINCLMVEADIELAEKKFEIAKVKFKESLTSLGTRQGG